MKLWIFANGLLMKFLMKSIKDFYFFSFFFNFIFFIFHYFFRSGLLFITIYEFYKFISILQVNYNFINQL
jgi:hypothetical protein